MDRYKITVTVTTETLSGAAYLYQIINKELWNQGVDPETIEGGCKLNNEDFSMPGEHGQTLTIDDLAFGLAETL